HVAGHAASAIAHRPEGQGRRRDGACRDRFQPCTRRMATGISSATGGTVKKRAKDGKAKRSASRRRKPRASGSRRKKAKTSKRERATKAKKTTATTKRSRTKAKGAGGAGAGLPAHGPRKRRVERAKRPSRPAAVARPVAAEDALPRAFAAPGAWERLASHVAERLQERGWPDPDPEVVKTIAALTAGYRTGPAADPPFPIVVDADTAVADAFVDF